MYLASQTHTADSRVISSIISKDIKVFWPKLQEVVCGISPHQCCGQLDLNCKHLLHLIWQHLLEVGWIGFKLWCTNVVFQFTNPSPANYLQDNVDRRLNARCSCCNASQFVKICTDGQQRKMNERRWVIVIKSLSKFQIIYSSYYLCIEFVFIWRLDLVQAHQWPNWRLSQRVTLPVASFFNFLWHKRNDSHCERKIAKRRAQTGHWPIRLTVAE